MQALRPRHLAVPKKRRMGSWFSHQEYIYNLTPSKTLTMNSKNSFDCAPQCARGGYAVPLKNRSCNPLSLHQKGLFAWRLLDRPPLFNS
jgi:hypothetical protein